MEDNKVNPVFPISHYRLRGDIGLVDRIALAIDGQLEGANEAVDIPDIEFQDSAT